MSCRFATATSVVVTPGTTLARTISSVLRERRAVEREQLVERYLELVDGCRRPRYGAARRDDVSAADDPHRDVGVAHVNCHDHAPDHTRRSRPNRCESG